MRAFDVQATFGFAPVPALRAVQGFAQPDALTPAADPDYRFNPAITQAILAGFAFNRRVLIQGLHGTGKSSHIEQVAARLNWPCLRINLDGHIGRLDLVGKDVIALENGQQVTRFEPGMLPWALQRPMALVFDEYDAGRPDVMFVIQRVLEKDGHFTLLEQQQVIAPHPLLRLFATANTVGQGNASGLYHGVQRLNQAQLDRWSVVAQLNYLAPDEEAAIVHARVPAVGTELVQQMVALANLTRAAWQAGDVSVLMTPRTVITWAENLVFCTDVGQAFAYAFLNKCEAEDRPVVAELYQRCFGSELPESALGSLPALEPSATLAG